MSPEAKALLALPGFAWAPGMVGIDPAGVRWVVYHVDEAGTPMAVRLGDPRVRPAVSPIVVGTVPDLGHAGTAGILLGMLPPDYMIERDSVDAYEVTIRGLPPADVALVDSHGSPGVGGAARWWSIAADSLGVAVARALIALGRAA